MLKYETLVLTHFMVNSTIFWDTASNEATVVDPGGDINLILDFAKDKVLSIKQIWLTHGHIDHVGGAMALKQATGASIYGPAKEDQFWLDKLPRQAKMFSFSFTEAFRPDEYAKDGDIVKIGDSDFNVIHCPGHTPGSVVYYQKELNLACVGDVLFQGSVGRTDFPQGNHTTLIKSITQKLWPLGDVDFIAGHGLNSNFKIERQSNPFVADFMIKANER